MAGHSVLSEMEILLPNRRDINHPTGN
jgi:hypothetical protein